MLGLPAAVTAGEKLLPGSVKFQAGDVLFLYSDGLFDCATASKDGRKVSKKGLLDIAAERIGDSSLSLETVLKELTREFIGSFPVNSEDLQDDVTAVLGRVPMTAGFRAKIR